MCKSEVERHFDRLVKSHDLRLPEDVCNKTNPLMVECVNFLVEDNNIWIREFERSTAHALFMDAYSNANGWWMVGVSLSDNTLMIDSMYIFGILEFWVFVEAAEKPLSRFILCAPYRLMVGKPIQPSLILDLSPKLEFYMFYWPHIFQSETFHPNEHFVRQLDNWNGPALRSCFVGLLRAALRVHHEATGPFLPATTRGCQRWFWATFFGGEWMDKESINGYKHDITMRQNLGFSSMNPDFIFRHPSMELASTVWPKHCGLHVMECGSSSSDNVKGGKSMH